jgi:hypothetical protein
MTIPDLPDNYPWLPGSERFPVGDIGELAARIGSPVTYDRRGEVLWYDIFERGVAGWTEQTGGNDGSVRVTADRPLIGGFAALLSSPSAGDEQIAMERFLNPAKVNKWGIEVAFAFTSVFNTFDIELNWIDGSNVWYGSIRVNYANEDVSYLKTLTTWSKIADLEIITIAQGMYNRIKLVCDFDSGKFERIMINQTEYDLSEVTMLKRSSSSGPYANLNLVFNGNIGNVRTMKVDSVIITANEP